MQEIDMSNPFDEDKIILELSNAHNMLAGLFEELAKYAGMIGDDLTQDIAVIVVESTKNISGILDLQ